MPLKLDYITRDEVKDAIGEKTQLADADIDRAVTAGSRAIELVTGRPGFGQTDAPQARSYTPTSPGLVVIHDAVSIDSVSVEGSALAADLWDGGPLNADLDDEPFLWIESDNRFTRKRKAIEVTATFGWPDVPFQVQQIALIVATKLLKRSREAPWGIVNSGGIDGIALRIAREDPDAQMLIGPLYRAETVS